MNEEQDARSRLRWRYNKPWSRYETSRGGWHAYITSDPKAEYAQHWDWCVGGDHNGSHYHESLRRPSLRVCKAEVRECLIWFIRMWCVGEEGADDDD